MAKLKINFVDTDHLQAGTTSDMDKMNGVTNRINEHTHEGTDTNKLTFSTCFTNAAHDHSNAANGGQLDWDACWADCVHNHSSSAEGGQLDWDTCWSDCVHNHSSTAEGGQFADLTITGNYNMATENRNYTIAPCDFTADSDVAYSYGGNGGYIQFDDTSADDFFAPVHLPQGAVVTQCVVYGNAGAQGDTWHLERSAVIGTGVSEMASANVGTADTSIANATISSSYAYHIRVNNLDQNDQIYGARIYYTITQPYP